MQRGMIFMGDIGKVMEESRFEDTKGNYMDQV